MAVLPGVLGRRLLRRTVQVRLGTNPAVARDGFPARGASACAARGTSIFVVSRQQFMKHPGSGVELAAGRRQPSQTRERRDKRDMREREYW